jgi:hypothetical protein
MPNAPWVKSFKVDGSPTGQISLEQIDSKQFELKSTVRYTGKETGLEAKLSNDALDSIRWVSPKRLNKTDLVSVPMPLRWFVGRYGIHTPAGLIHDWLIPQPSDPEIPGMKDEHADRYWRFMLEDLEVPLIRRWLMWAAVAARTRWQRGLLFRVLLSLWVLASLAGTTAFVVGVLNGNYLLIVAATFAPVVFALLWDRQYGAGIVAAYSAPWILPPTLLAAVGYGAYWIVERLVGLPFGSRTATKPVPYRDF